MVQIIGISGKQGAGKTTLSKLLEAALEENFDFAQVHRLRFAHYIYLMHDAIRSIMLPHAEGLKALGIDYDFEKKDGVLLQLLGTEWGRNTVNQNIWSALTRLEVDRILDQSIVGTTPFILIEDMRFENEFDILDPERTLKIRLEASEEVRKERAEMWRENTTHPSEVSLDQYSKDDKFNMYFHADVVSANDIVQEVIKELKEGS